VQCLDVLRVLSREPDALAALLAEIERAHDPRLRQRCEAVRVLLAAPEELLPRARQLVEELSLCLSASLLQQHAPEEVADGYMAARIEARSLHYGCLPVGIDRGALLSRALPG
jgi:putative acyl-CoA dehydrogenase